MTRRYHLSSQQLQLAGLVHGTARWQMSLDSQALPGNVLSCKGFANCYAEAIDQLGPMLVTVTP